MIKNNCLCSWIMRRHYHWNNLPVDLRLSRTFTTFKTYLKSHLFNLFFPSVWLYHWLYHWLFLYRALEAASAAYTYLNLSLLHYITLQCLALTSITSSYSYACSKVLVIICNYCILRTVVFFRLLVTYLIMGYWHQRADERHGKPPPR